MGTATPSDGDQVIKRFEHTGKPWSGLDAAQKWCHKHGYDTGSMQRGEPTGVAKAPALVAKWRNMSPAERKRLGGTMRPAGDRFMDSACILDIRTEETEDG